MFCLNYYPSQEYLQDADELKIVYNPADETLRDFLDHFINKSIVISLLNLSIEDMKKAIEFFQVLTEKYKNFKLIIPYNQELLTFIKEKPVPFFFSNFVSTVDEMHGLMQYHPTDMYICEELGFSLNKVSEILHQNNIKVRVFPNICQSSFPETPSLMTFFIRPEDISFFENYVDVFELISTRETQKVLYRIYNQDRKWFGKLNEIIPTFKDELDSRYIIGAFAEVRGGCGKRCLYKPGSCDICQRVIDLSKTFQNNHLMIRPKKS